MKEQYNDIALLSQAAATKGTVPFDEAAWKKMEAMLDEKDDKKPLIYWWNNKMIKLFFVTMLLTIGGIGIYKSTIKNKEVNKNIYTKRVEKINGLADTTKSALAATNTIKNEKLPKQEINASEDNNMIANDYTYKSNNSKYKYTDKIAPLKEVNTIETAKRNLKKKVNSQTENSVPFLYNDTNSNEQQLPTTLNEAINDVNTEKKETNEIVIIEKNSNDSTLATANTDSPTAKLPASTNDTLISKLTPITPITSAKKSTFLSKFSFAPVAVTEYNTVKFKNFTKPTVQYGINMMYAITKKLTIKAGLLKGTKDYKTDKSGYAYKPGSFWSTIDSFNVTAQCNMIDVPIGINFALTQSKRYQLFGGVGITSYWLKKEDYNFEYKRYGTPYNRSYSYANQNKKYFANLNLSIGYQNTISKKVALLVEPYAKLPIQGIGDGKVKLTSLGVLVGIQFSPWKK